MTLGASARPTTPTPATGPCQPSWARPSAPAPPASAPPDSLLAARFLPGPLTHLPGLSVPQTVGSDHGDVTGLQVNTFTFGPEWPPGHRCTCLPYVASSVWPEVGTGKG